MEQTLKGQTELRELPVIEGWELATRIEDAGDGIAEVTLEGIRNSDGAYHEVSSRIELSWAQRYTEKPADTLELLIQDFIKSVPAEHTLRPMSETSRKLWATGAKILAGRKLHKYKP